MNLEIRHEPEDGIDIVYLTGEIDAYTAPQLREALIPLAEKKGQVIVTDLTEVNYIDSTGLGIFIGVLKATHQHESSLKLKGLSERIKRLFSITGLDEVIEIEAGKREEAK
ncbi:STAS domain-containing protein [Halalkalibacter urbisdiaboli]|uniref:STAS domain-containing protein n=1 Tax=Halalkalibacter urbisdiaboli TaxID=1960589 RepID=UPI000B44CB49|nr:STAS domain-containing protein [Halalkalibacter urbisdiaboli]